MGGRRPGRGSRYGTWPGRYCPGDEGADDPENMSNWRICYTVELVEDDGE